MSTVSGQVYRGRAKTYLDRAEEALAEWRATQLPYHYAIAGVWAQMASAAATLAMASDEAGK